MSACFFDSSALVKNYADEDGSDFVAGLLDPGTGSEVYVAHISVVEVVAAIRRSVRRGDVDEERARGLIREFRAEVGNIAHIAAVSEEIIEDAATLAERHVLRAYDAVQLSVALSLNKSRVDRDVAPLILVSSDRELNVAAGLEGLDVLPPASHES